MLSEQEHREIYQQAVDIASFDPVLMKVIMSKCRHWQRQTINHKKYTELANACTPDEVLNAYEAYTTQVATLESFEMYANPAVSTATVLAEWIRSRVPYRPQNPHDHLILGYDTFGITHKAGVISFWAGLATTVRRPPIAT